MSEKKQSSYKKNDLVFYLVLLLLYIFVTHPATFTTVNNMLGTSFVGNELASNLNTKIIMIHGLVLCLLMFLFCKFVKPMLNLDE